MRAAKRKKLEAAGWRVGSAAEFLDLSPEEVVLVEIKLALARSVRDRRLRRDMTQAQLATFLGSSQSRVAKMEAGDRSVSIDLLVLTLVRMGVTRNELAKALRTKAA